MLQLLISLQEKNNMKKLTCMNISFYCFLKETIIDFLPNDLRILQVVRKAVTAGYFANACRLEVWAFNVQKNVPSISAFENIIFIRKQLTKVSHTSLQAFSHSGMYKTLRGSQEVYIHPSSILFRLAVGMDV